MLTDETTSETFSAFVEEHEARLRHALTARFGSEVDKEAAADALAYGWEHWERVSAMENPVGWRRSRLSNVDHRDRVTAPIGSGYHKRCFLLQR